jgi:hypothetical protein
MYKIKKFKPSLNVKVVFIGDVILSYSISNKHININCMNTHMIDKYSIHFHCKYYIKVYDGRRDVFLFMTKGNAFQFIPDKIIFGDHFYINIKGVPFDIRYNCDNDTMKITY